MTHEASGTLTLCGTPIGNLGDVSERMAETLRSADVVFAEDTRRTATLLNHIGASVRMRSFFAGNERTRLAELGELLGNGASVVLVTDAGMPVVSDPGASAVTVAVDVGASVTVVPGPSAVLAALAVSGFSGDTFVFEGFLPRKGTDRSDALTRIASETRTVVAFAAPTRVGADLRDLADACGAQRPVVVTRELTKIHEQVWRGTLVDAAEYWSGEGTARGEFTVVVAGADAPPSDLVGAVARARSLIDAGLTRSAAVKEVARMTGVRRNDLYEAVITDAETNH